MKVLIFWEDFLYYHTARISASMRYASQSGHKIIPVAIRSGSPALTLPGYHSMLGEDVILLSNDPLNHNMQSRESAHQLLSVLDRESPDVVVIPGYDSRVALAALGWCRKNRRGAVLMSDSQQRDFHRSYWKESLKILLVSQYDAAFVAGKSQEAYMCFLQMPPDRIYTGCDVVDNSYWGGWSERVRQNPGAWREKLNLPEKYFLTVCRLVPKKNVAGLLRAYALYTQQASDPWHLVIAGDGSLRNELELLANNLGIKSSVHFMGYLSSEQAGPVYGLASCFVLASAYSEQWGLVVNEAMAAGLPVLVSEICGCVDDLIINGVTGFAFDPNKFEQLSSLLLRMTNNKELIISMGEASKRHIKNYSLDLFANNLIASATHAFSYSKTRKINIWPFPLVLP